MDILTHRFEVLDGYRMVRFLGRGGFGEVWLCRSTSMGDYRALKFIPTGNADQLEKEYEALLHYRNAAARLRSPHLVPIEHVNRIDAGLYYIMPLADGPAQVDPSDPTWFPMSLATVIHDRAESGTWFSSGEIISLMTSVLEALQTLSDAGLVHRDVKPENILFFNGSPCLGDISLLGADTSTITRRGTPGYATPSWYVGGHPDMYGAAATFFALLTGNSPDRMGRAAFLWPPRGETSLTQIERAEWKRLHGVIRRATEDKVSERFVDFRTMAKALVVPSLHVGADAIPPPTLPPASRRGRKLIPWLLGGPVLLAAVIVIISSPDDTVSPPQPNHEIVQPVSTVDIARDQPVAPELRTPKTVDAMGRFTPLRQKVIKAIPSALGSETADKVMRLDPTDYSGRLDVLRSYESRDYQACFDSLNVKIDADPSLLRNPLCLLLKSLLLSHLDRTDEADRVLDDFRKLSMTPAAAPNEPEMQLDLMEALALHEEAEKFISEVIEQTLANPDLSKLEVSSVDISELVTLYNRRARIRILNGDMAGALSDEHTALGLPPGIWPGIVVNKEKSAQSHLNTIVMQWELLEQEFPAYDQYLAGKGSPEPKPDRRNLDAID